MSASFLAEALFIANTSTQNLLSQTVCLLSQRRVLRQSPEFVKKISKWLTCYHFWFYFLPVFRALRGRPTLRSFTASRSFGSISHSRPYLNAFRRLASIKARTLGVTPNRFAASKTRLSALISAGTGPRCLRRGCRGRGCCCVRRRWRFRRSNP